MSLNYKEWKSLAITEYDIVSKKYSKKVYENMVADPDTRELKLMQLTLRDVLDKCDGTNFETPIRKAVMKCVYTDSKIEREVTKVMDAYFEV